MKKTSFLILIVCSIVCSNSVLSQINKIVPADLAEEDAFGWSVDIYGNYALIGSVYDDDNGIQSGSAYIYHFDGTQWTEHTKITASDGGFADYFGYAVSIHDGQLIVGAYRDFVGSVRSGSAYVYTQDGGSWVETAKLVPDDPEEEDRFGAKVAIYGNYAAVGAYFDDDLGESSGAVYVYKKSAGEWAFHQKLTPESLLANDYFGASVTISEDFLFVGAQGSSAYANTSGKVFIYTLLDGTWTLSDEVYPPDPTSFQNFGVSLSVSGETLAIGAYNDPAVANESGSVYLFEKTGSNWEFFQKIFPSDGHAGAKFGHSLAIENNRLVVGSIYDQTLPGETGSAYVYTRESSGNWLLSAKIVPDDAQDEQRFSAGVGLSGKFAIAGAPYDNEYGFHTGAAYLCDLDIILHQQETNFSTKQSVSYPNPATNAIMILLPNDERKAVITIYNLFGMQLIEKQIIESQTSIDITSLKPGNYIYSVQYQNGLREHHRWIKL